MLSRRARQSVSRPTDVDTRRSLAHASDTRMLSNREAEILHCLMQGAPNKIIARQLDVAEATVKVHVKAILRKIQVANRTQAAMWAVEHLSPTGGEDPGNRIAVIAAMVIRPAWKMTAGRRDIVALLAACQPVRASPTGRRPSVEVNREAEGEQDGSL